MEAVKVWVSNYAGHDFSAATRYGELGWITKGYVSFQSLDRVKYQITEQVVSSTKKDDWLLISGRPIISCIAALVWYSLHGQVKILHWDQKTSTYRELIVTKGNVDELIRVLSNGNSPQIRPAVNG